ncbi:MAG: formylglycine-generating enzyme family protein, partial [Gammaproteobacteria bacterium]|nr:formylglycine-generating enzyme family protein [Gammaproteobacteria bacterium]
FTKWLAKKSGRAIRLLTEAEWEYVTRAESAGIRFWGNDPADACRYANVHDKTGKSENGFFWLAHQCDDGHAQTAPVGSFSDNGFGLHDTLGNVWEWTCSAHTSSYDGSEKNCASTGGAHRVVRGGSWLSFPGSVRSAYRSGIDPASGYYDLGFRLVKQQ